MDFSSRLFFILPETIFMPPLKIGFHDFLNAQPVLVPLRNAADSLGFDLILDTPAALAQRLQTGELDLAMIPSIEFLREEYRLLPGVSISSRGPVGTVLLVSRKPLERIQTLALDKRSRTSAALLRILSSKVLPDDIEYSTADPDPKAMLETHDAALIIGDQALQMERRPEWVVHDLSQIWFEQTGKTFVHAVVAVRPEVELQGEVVEAIQKAKVKGFAELEAIVKSQSAKTGIAEERCRDYLEHKIIYDLGERELDGLSHFQDLCLQHSLLDRKRPLAGEATG